MSSVCSGERDELLKEKIPSFARCVLGTLNQAGHEAYFVGGCVRDLLTGKQPCDWDVCTSAKPEEIAACFSGRRMLDVGIKHGTVAVELGGAWVEITTYRIDGEYRDGRHPDAVQFTDLLENDLARRDFTMNAMAFHPAEGVVDPFYGLTALRDRQILCVGDAERRFSEDALRIMRGLRFASTLDFEISEETAEAMRRCADLVKRISAERVQAELSKLLTGVAAGRILHRYGGILEAAIPGLRTQSCVSQHLFCDTAELGHPRNLAICLAAVFPEQTEACLRNLKFSRQIIYDAAATARLAQVPPPQDPVQIRKLLSEEGERRTRLYFAAFGKEADVQSVLDSGSCWNLEQLAVNGRDLMDAGIVPGCAVGALLQELLQLVIEEKLDNHRSCLLKYIREMGETIE